MSLISELLLRAVGVSAGLLSGVTVNVLGRAIPLAMETEWRRHAAGLRDIQAGVRLAMLKAAAGAFYVECQLCLHSAPLGNFSPLLELVLRGGYCRSCGTRIVPWRLALPELACVAAGVAMLYRHGPGLAAAGGLLYVGALVLLALTSVQRQLMPNAAAPGARRGEARLVRLLQRAAHPQEEMRASFDARQEFTIKLIPYDGDDAWVEGAGVGKCGGHPRHAARAPEPPAVNGECEYCRFAHQAMRAAGA